MKFTIKINNSSYPRILASATCNEQSRFEHLDSIVLQSNGVAYATNGRLLIIASDHHAPWTEDVKRIAVRVQKISDIPVNTNEIVFNNGRAEIGARLLDVVTDLNYPNVHNIIKNVTPTDIPSSRMSVTVIPAYILSALEKYEGGKYWMDLIPKGMSALSHPLPDLHIIAMGLAEMDDKEAKKARDEKLQMLTLIPDRMHQ